jgi:GxxExxY protein
MLELELLTEKIIGAAIEVHRELGPGALESSYERCLAWELADRGLRFERQPELPVIYKGKRLDCGYRLDLVVEKQVVIEIKAVEKLLPIHTAQLMTYLRLGNFPVSLLINFNVVRLVDGLVRRANTRPPSPATPPTQPPRDLRP